MSHDPSPASQTAQVWDVPVRAGHWLLAISAIALLARREPVTLGHNALGGWMIVALLLTTTLVAASGWLYTTDRYWGVEWVETLHSTLADALLILIGLHVAGVLYASWRHRENLVAAMVHGRKCIRDTMPH